MQQPRHLARIATAAMLLCTIAGMTGMGGLWPTTGTTYANDAGPATTSISFSNPGALTTTVAAGDDFATNVLGDAWDMDKTRDIGYEIGLTNIQANSGIWSATFSGVDQATGGAASGYIFPLFQGFSTPIGAQLSQELAVTKVGALDQYAINAAKYTQLSYRMSVSPRTIHSPLAVYWTAAKPVTWPTSSNYFARTDGCQGVTNFFLWDAWNIYNFDLTASNGAPGAQAGSWGGTVRGLRIDPAAATTTAGTQVQIDWIRLTDPSSATKIVIPWSTEDATGSDRVEIYYADNPSGSNAAPLVTGLMASAGSYTLPTSILPPGTHYFQLRLKSSAENGCTITKATSAWVGPLTITDKPVISFSKPNMTSGPDYASEVLGNPWDMADSSDVVTPGSPYPETLANKTYSNGIFSARAVLTPPNTESDSQLWLNIDASKPIDPSRYRYFSVRLKVDMPANKDINWAIANGWGGRIIWWNTLIQTDGSESKFGAYYEGWRTYSVDLARAIPPQALGSAAQIDNILTPREQNSFPAQLGWTQMSNVKQLRYDPLETMAAAVGSGADVFSIDWIKLTAIDEVKQGNLYSIEAGANVDATSLDSISFYYTTDRSQPTQHPATQATLTGIQATPAGEASYAVYLPLVNTPFQSTVEGNPVSYKWDTTGVTPGTYYICSTASLGASTATSCSDAPVKVLP